LADSVDWRVRKGPGVRSFSEGLVVQGRRRGVLDLSACLLAGEQASPAALGLLGPLVAASTSEGIRKDTGIVSWLYWPNLVTIDDRVVAKTRTLLSPAPPGSDGGDARGATQILVEISVDCFASSSAFPSFALPSTSILEVLGVEIDVDLLRDKVLHALEWYHAEWERGMHQKLAERMRPTVAWFGRSVEVTMAGRPPLRGEAKGLDDVGSLLLEQHGGKGRRPRTIAVRPEGVELVRVVR
jgi:biotin-(acetyl-CoA carboxylase) ligase